MDKDIILPCPRCAELIGDMEWASKLLEIRYHKHEELKDKVAEFKLWLDTEEKNCIPQCNGEINISSKFYDIFKEEE